MKLLYLTYLPKDQFKYAMKMHCDNCSSFTELVQSSLTVVGSALISASMALRE